MFEDRRTSDALPSLTAALAWGAMFPIAASAIHHVDAFHLTAVRYLVATAIFLGLLALIEGGRALLPQGRALELFILGTLGFAGFNLFTYLALEHVRPQDASLIVATSPLLTVFAVWLTTRQKPSRTTFGAMLVALFGVMLVITHGDPSALGGSAGDLLVLAGVASFVAYTTGARRFADFSPLRYTALSATGGTLTILAVTAILTLTGTYPMPSAANWGDAWTQTIYIIVAGAVIGVLAWNEGVRRIGAANGALFMNLVPVVTFAVEIGRGYRPGEFEILGALLTIGALVFANLAARPRRVLEPELANA
ncbi:DMT family transporter [Solirubrobacter soli]|uniref:DMT family transporter n=1 Tax=Solirubrobacter soli TaxID=363832 RepID=UPI000419E4B8|nr:DMT family transporter [Solirubrobacter soli]